MRERERERESVSEREREREYAQISEREKIQSKFLLEFSYKKYYQNQFQLDTVPERYKKMETMIYKLSIVMSVSL